MEDYSIDIFNNVLESIVVFMSQCNICMLPYKILKQHRELTTVIGYFLSLNLQFDALDVFILLDILEFVVNCFHVFVHGSMPLFYDAHSLSNACVKTKHLFILENKTTN